MFAAFAYEYTVAVTPNKAMFYLLSVTTALGFFTDYLLTARAAPISDVENIVGVLHESNQVTKLLSTALQK